MASDMGLGMGMGMGMGVWTLRVWSRGYPAVGVGYNWRDQVSAWANCEHGRICDLELVGLAGGEVIGTVGVQGRIRRIRGRLPLRRCSS